MESTVRIKPDPDSILAADQTEWDTDNNHIGVDKVDQDSSVLLRPIKQELIESPEVDPAELINEDEGYVFINDKIELVYGAAEEPEGGVIEEAIEPVNSIIIKVEATSVDSCDTDAISNFVQTGGASGQQPVAEGDTRIESNAKKNIGKGGRRNKKPVDPSKAKKMKFSCDICQRPFGDKTALSRHLHGHTGEKPFQCQICEKTFAHLSTLNVHAKLHTGQNPFRCTVCEKTFPIKEYLRIHSRIHTGEKPYECEVCRMTFATSNSYIVHKRNHSDEKPYKCQLCEKAFKQHGGLVVHNRVHTGEKPYVCQVCNKAFSQMNHLKYHKKVHGSRELAQPDDQ